ncbi:MAG: histidinol dehydrogenase [Polyangiaceae bacterium]|nr:histidinol dehydrogenase [Polyangiaceae bacterium]MCW5792664.1 histidinol dehydrogenase [Polyangiaceae bacterium]
MLTRVSQPSPAFDALLQRLARRGEQDLAAVEPAVRAILGEVREGGDAAVRAAVRRFEAREVGVVFQREYGGEEALRSLPAELRSALTLATARIQRFHERQLELVRSFEYEEAGVSLGTRVDALERVGVYAPGGKARYPSSVLMSAVVARVAGVPEIVLATPDPPAVVRAAAYLSGVTAILDAGGAQAIGALAYGTESVPRVDKVVGPGNLYVAAAKRLVYGDVDIDSIAGPSEILVVADDSADPRWVAADLLSQAEHDEAAYPLLVTTSPALVSGVERELESQLASLPRREVASQSLTEHGYALVVDSHAELSRVASLLAVEHVAVQTRTAREDAALIRGAGALFIGPMTPEAAGDYLAGPSHVLPTGGASRFASALGIPDFVRRTSTIAYQAPALAAQAEAITTLARSEGLEAHARAVEIRQA